MAFFFDYEQNKVFWFVTYLRLAEAICLDPSISVKNSDFKSVIDAYERDLEKWERLFYGADDKVQERVGM